MTYKIYMKPITVFLSPKGIWMANIRGEWSLIFHCVPFCAFWILYIYVWPTKKTQRTFLADNIYHLLSWREEQMYALELNPKAWILFSDLPLMISVIVMAKFVLTWLGHRAPRYVIKHHSGYVCEGISGWDSHLN